jgi:hypothetical protein
VKQLIRWHEFSNMNMHIHILLHTHTHTRAHHECKHHRCTDEAQINVSFVSIGGPTGLALAADSEKPVFHTLAASTPRENECMCMRVYEYIYISMYVCTHQHTHTTHTRNTHMHLYKLPPTSLHKSYSHMHKRTLRSCIRQHMYCYRSLLRKHRLLRTPRWASEQCGTKIQACMGGSGDAV